MLVGDRAEPGTAVHRADRSVAGLHADEPGLTALVDSGVLVAAVLRRLRGDRCGLRVLVDGGDDAVAADGQPRVVEPVLCELLLDGLADEPGRSLTARPGSLLRSLDVRVAERRGIRGAQPAL